MRPLTLIALVASGCTSGGHFLRVHLSNVPPSAAHLEVATALGNDVAPTLTFLLSGDASPTFALSLPNQDMWLSATVSAQDPNNCDLAIAAAGIEAAFALSTLDVDLGLVARDGSECGVQHTPGMYSLPAGSYILGCDMTSDPTCQANIETPTMTVQLPAYELDATEVTVGAYNDCVLAGGCLPATPYNNTSTNVVYDLPDDSAQNGVSWDQAGAFCQWENKILPSEAQWEGAMRNATANLFPWGNADPTCDLANYADSTTTICATNDDNLILIQQHPDGVTPRGFYDGAGNVAEWVEDWYAPRSSLTNAEYVGGPPSGTMHLQKGGSFAGLDGELRGAFRDPYFPDGSTATNAANLFFAGFRCAKAL